MYPIAQYYPMSSAWQTFFDYSMETTDDSQENILV